jgi:hypothetical protein
MIPKHAVRRSIDPADKTGKSSGIGSERWRDATAEARRADQAGSFLLGLSHHAVLVHKGVSVFWKIAGSH